MRDNVILLYISVMVRVGLGVVPALYCKKNNIVYIVVILSTVQFSAAFTNSELKGSIFFNQMNQKVAE
jgi:hypothetical protein